MNTTQFTKIAESNLKPGEEYFLRTKWGEGMVTALESTREGWHVNIKQGIFKPPFRRYTNGDIMPVASGTGNFYEVRG